MVSDSFKRLSDMRCTSHMRAFILALNAFISVCCAGAPAATGGLTGAPPLFSARAEFVSHHAIGIHLIRVVYKLNYSQKGGIK